ncbi:hypothetical protein O3G_MSEX000707, partial [Manduca sexta]
AHTAQRLRDIAQRTTPHDLSAWSGYKHRCDCLTPRTLCAQQRKQLLNLANRISCFGMTQAATDAGVNGATGDALRDNGKVRRVYSPFTKRKTYRAQLVTTITLYWIFL